MNPHFACLECSLDGSQYPAGEVFRLSDAGRPLLVRYRLHEIAAAVDRDELAAREGGVLMCPEGAATHAAWLHMTESGELAPGAQVVLFNCATGLKYALPEV